jgi:hypothetical protein
MITDRTEMVDLSQLPVVYYTKILSWCLETLGPMCGEWVFDEETNKLYLSDSSATIFALRWC